MLCCLQDPSQETQRYSPCCDSVKKKSRKDIYQTPRLKISETIKSNLGIPHFFDLHINRNLRDKFFLPNGICMHP